MSDMLNIIDEVKQKFERSESNHKLILGLSLFRLKGKPYRLDDHYFFRPLFRSDLPRKVLYKCARQVGKTQNMSVARLTRTICMPHYNSLFVCPRFEQIKRISNNYMRPLINDSPCKDLFVDYSRGNEQSIMQRTFRNGSLHYYSFAFLDAERIRSISCNNVNIDEVQDIVWDFIPVIGETMSGSKYYRDQVYTGTPKTFENTIEKLWQESSMAAWATRCGCGHWNIACASQDLIKMIGKTSVCCAKCSRNINPREGGWVHFNTELQDEFVGYHVPQIVHPYHFESEKNWKDLHFKMRTYPQAKFWNECLGESFDSATKLMTLRDLRSISSNRINNVEKALMGKRGYAFTVMGIDWGGGGDASESYTSVTIVGHKPGNDQIEVLYTCKFNRNLMAHEETHLILDLIKKFNPNLIAHDYGGAGNLREVMLLQAGVPAEKIIPFTYAFTANKEVIYYNAPKNTGTRSSYTLDKPRSLVTLCAMMKAGKISLTEFESSKNCFGDFLNLVEEVQERPRGSDVVLISKAPGTCDDTCHSLNYACSAIWYYHQRYPDLAEAMQIKLTQDEINSIAPPNLDINDWTY